MKGKMKSDIKVDGRGIWKGKGGRKVGVSENIYKNK